MKLCEELELLTQEVREGTVPHVLHALEKTIRDLKNVNFSQRALRVEETASNFSLPDAYGTNIKLSQLLVDGPVILTFYRGGWCPYCNLTLRALQKVLPDVQALGAQVVAISPERPDHSLLTTHKNRLDFVVLSDMNSEVARKFGVSFTVPVYLNKLYRTFGLNLEKYNGAKTVELPLPATFLIDTHQVVKYAFVNEDYTQRADTDEILKVLAALKQEECVYC